MLSGLISIGIALWFYRTAGLKSAPAIQWAFVGFISYLLPNMIWTFIVTRPLVVSQHANQNLGFSTTLVNHSGILVGLTVAVFVWYTILNKLDSSSS